MQIKRYEAANMQEATIRIKNDLGPDAIILSTGRISGKPHLIEVLAGRDEKTPAAVVPEGLLREKGSQSNESLSRLEREIHDLKSGIEGLKQEIPCRSDLYDLKEAMNLVLDTISVQYPAQLQNMYAKMLAGGFSRLKAAALLETIRNSFARQDLDNEERCAAIAEKLIARSLAKSGPKERRIKALIGPTGVGKTTTLAKLAAHYSLERKVKVGMITTDTYRIGATEQLKIYAKIMGLPIRIASTKESFLSSVADFAEKEIILVDTPGRSHNDERGLNELKSVLNPEVETFLLLNPVAGREHLIDTANRFGIFDYDRIILTKVDECSRFGSMYEVLDEIGKPVSHVTTGQNVPRDIEKASPERLARMILQNRLN